MKQKSPAALLVGSVPGALPPLIGWTAVTGRLEWAGIALFGVLFFWQLPHFIAIAIFRQEEYTRAGIKVLPAVRGLRVAKVHAVVHSRVAVGRDHGRAGAAAGRGLAVPGRRPAARRRHDGASRCAAFASDAGHRWARQLFAASLIYLPLLFAALALDALV